MKLFKERKRKMKKRKKKKKLLYEIDNDTSR